MVGRLNRSLRSLTTQAILWEHQSQPGSWVFSRLETFALSLPLPFLVTAGAVLLSFP